ncbi:acyltransferase [Alteromonadaceae bacterium BrNp21-10]|nr:acyltransferase [Alteromonadaceae bacterium BrNp21-10]
MQSATTIDSPATVTAAKTSVHIPALTGVRFFAVFHIFLFHLWSVYNGDKAEGFENLMIGFASMPQGLVSFLSNGFLSTPFFFMLSGFILSYLYWGKEGQLTISRKQFWLSRLFRLYPIHLIVIVPTILLMFYNHLQNGFSGLEVAASAVASITLTQAWYAPWVPMWSWPTWTISALVFLYLVMPWLMHVLGKLTQTQSVILLMALPIISMVPTAIYAWLTQGMVDVDIVWAIVIGSTPLFWVPHFIAGMLLTRIFAISRFNSDWRPAEPSWFAWGDVALLGLIVYACMGTIAEPLKFFIRHGLFMPLYMQIILDFARGNGIFARIFSLPGMQFLGELSFSIFIWQNIVMIFCWISLMINPATGHYHILGASVVIVLLSILSTYKIEKPLANKLQRKYLS